MRKLQLDLGTLHVECFELAPSRDARGTVAGAAQTDGPCWTEIADVTCAHTNNCPLTLESIAVNCPSMYCESEPGWTRFCPEEDPEG